MNYFYDNVIVCFCNFCKDESSLHIFLNISFCVLQKKLRFFIKELSEYDKIMSITIFELLQTNLIFHNSRVGEKF